MEKRLITAVIASVAILYIFQAMFTVDVSQPPADKQATEVIEEPAVEKASIEEPESQVSKIQEPPEEEQTLVVSNKRISFEISSLGSGLRSFEIEDKKEGFVDLVIKEQAPLPLSSAFAPDKNWALRNTSSGAMAEIKTKDASYFREFELGEDDILQISNRIVNHTNSRLSVQVNQSWYGGLGATRDMVEDNPEDNSVFAKIDGKVEKDLSEGKHVGKIDWAGLSNRYFIAAFLDLPDSFTQLEVLETTIDGEEYPSADVSGNLEIAPRSEVRFTQKIYGGLKEYKTLSALAPDLENILSFGIFGFLSRLFLKILLVFNSIVGNYGIAIIMLTFVLQFFLIPLTVKSYKSMHAMKELQPEIEKLKKKYKDNPQRMNQEMMAIYKKRGVNPLSGCFPLLLQMPIFISLFTMLREVAELRYAGFLWIGDLSAPDSLFSTLPVLSEIPYVGQYGPLPLLMGGAMFLQQKVTAGSKGPQKSLTYMMPIVFTFLFMGFPAGLVLYWLTNSIITFFIQFFIGKKK